MATYHVWTVGCQMNKADSTQLAKHLERMGYHPAPLEQADLIVLNSCSVRQSAENRVTSKLGTLRALRRRRPEVHITLMGCMVDGDTHALAQHFPHVDLFLRPQAFEALLEVAHQRSVHVHVSPQPLMTPVPVTAFVPIIHGCDNFCSYCIVPFRRGREKSLPLEEVICQVDRLVQRGVKEITLLGQNVDSYGHDLPGKPDLARLLGELNNLEGLERIRFLTSHPKDMTDRLIQSVARLEKVCKHINLPVQAGDDDILKAMKREYAVVQYRALVGRIRHTIPGVSLSTDVIVGFPGEMEEQFNRTYLLLQEMRFDTVHVAAYSARPGTAASRLPDDVPASEKHRRLQAVEALQERIAGEINAPLVGQEVEVLVEEQRGGKWMGRTRTNKLVFFSHSDDWRGQTVRVLIEDTSPWSLKGGLT